MKMVMVTYNEAIDDEVVEVMNNCGLMNFTKMVKIYGKGGTSGTHLGNDIWPGLNNMLYIACQDSEAKKLLGHIKDMRLRLGKEGVKAFVVPLEEVT